MIRITIYEIAELAGVSRGTVSRVLNNSPNVKQETRTHVQNIIATYGYVPSGVARSLATKKSGVVGVIVYNITRPFWSNTIAGLEDAAHPTNYDLFFVNSKPRDSVWDQDNFYKEHLRNLVKHKVDGIIIALLNNIDQEDIDYLQDADMPFVVMQNGLTDSRITSVNVDNFQGGKDATNYLISLGHKKIFHITGPINSSTSQDRLNGYLKAMEEAGLPIQKNWVIKGGHSVKDGYNAMKSIVASGDIPTAIFFSCDEAATGGIIASREESIKIPDDISIIGYDGIDNYLVTSNLFPKLTTMRQPISEVGSLAFNHLFELMSNHESCPKQSVLKATLIEGETCRKLE